MIEPGTQTGPSAKTRKQAVTVPMEGSMVPELKGGVPEETGPEALVLPSPLG